MAANKFCATVDTATPSALDDDNDADVGDPDGPRVGGNWVGAGVPDASPLDTVSLPEYR